MNIETFFNSDSSKRFYSPSAIFWGHGIADEVLKDLKTSTAPVVLFIDRFFQNHPVVLELQKLNVSGMFIVSQEPSTALVDGAFTSVKGKPAKVIALGGGSTIDAAKAYIAKHQYGTYDGIGMGEKRFLEPKDPLFPEFIAIPTTAGTGAETSRYYVIYDSETKHKIHGKSWRLTAHKVFLDSQFLTTCDSQLLVLSAFDAFVHLFESFTCRYERSWINETISCAGIPKIMMALKRVVTDKEKNLDALLDLQVVSTMAGVAISNVRTGHIHEGAGVLLEESAMTHPETLFVFFRKGVEQNLPHIRDREIMLLQALNANGFSFTSLMDVVSFWEKLFASVGLIEKIVEKSKILLGKKAHVRARVFDRVFSDKVWVNKENPIPLSADDVYSYIDSALNSLYQGLAR